MHKPRMLAAAAAAILVAFVGMTPSANAQHVAAPADEETQAGAQLFDELRQKGELVKSSPLYDVLQPIAASITRVVQPKYSYPIHFYIVHEKSPNAFAAPGGNIYVVDSLFTFVKSRDELIGTLCHESSHLLHHDSINLTRRDRALQRGAVAAQILLGPTIGTVIATNVIADLTSLHFSRDAEEAADLAGADTCAAGANNPWGLVWLLQDFEAADLQSPPEFLSDHPGNEHRIAALTAHLRGDPKTFARFNADRTSATALRLPADLREEFYPATAAQ